ncbi:UNVERIFIED_CONTAM: hypothetical protein Sradi_5062800 [Sesamum radiatum]|uniref:Uncharacterized protein n=1 Tax=Sesamum radiatum TaxID=300843 RepID=A0AAW2M0F8_SESRA
MRAIRWHMNCMLRYSDEPMLGTMATMPNTTVWSELNVTSPDRFKEVLGALMDDLRGKAAYGGSSLKAAAGNRSGLIRLFMQCCSARRICLMRVVIVA